MSNHIFVGLVHSPIYNKNKEIITTSVTNLDIHDIARCVATYDVEKYFIIHPLENQYMFVQEMVDYWQKGYGALYNPDRKEALERVDVKKSIEDVQNEIKLKYNTDLYTIVTDAKVHSTTVSYIEMRKIIETDADRCFLLLFGTGWGMTEETMENADYILEPIYGRGSYNHLSVRSAVSIIHDRLLGEKWWK